MAGSPRKRVRREIEESGDEAREAFQTAARERLAEQRRAREEAEDTVRAATAPQLREEALDKFWPMAERVVERALRGEEVNREQLSAAFKILEQRFGRPGQQQEDPSKDEPTVIIYESAAIVH